jgi:hypothetical protein
MNSKLHKKADSIRSEMEKLSNSIRSLSAPIETGNSATVNIDGEVINIHGKSGIVRELAKFLKFELEKEHTIFKDEYEKL